MKFFLLIGGGCGFLLSFGAGLIAGNDLMIALRDGAIGCVAAALLMRGFFSIYMGAVKDLAAGRARERMRKNEEVSVN